MQTDPSSLNLSGFPILEIGSGTELFRIHLHRDRSGDVRHGWFFSSIGGVQAGRFDLPTPKGTCYFSNRKYGSWQEVFRGTRYVNRDDVDCRRILIATRTTPSLRLADMSNPNTSALGVSLDLFSGDDYTQPQSWAAAFHKFGFFGVIALLRHDPSGNARNFGIFGNSGSRSKVKGWSSQIRVLIEDEELIGELREQGITVQGIPHEVKVTPFP